MFLAEDEIVTREGIRDNVDWGAAGFDFCGEAPDGEIAFQRIQETKPDVLITDIKMPFMDGLQLSKLVREHMPWVKIIILSGHDEFGYAQSAVKLGVTEYLLKPISSQDLHEVLLRTATILDKEGQELEKLKRMQTKFEDSLVLSREKFLMDLVMGTISSAEAIEQSQQLGMDIVARYYQVALVKVELCQASQPFDYHEYKSVERIVSEFAGNNMDVFLTKKDFEELVLFIKGDDREQLIEEGKFLTVLISNEIEKQTDCGVMIEIGSLQDRLGNVHLSFFDALLKSKPHRSNQDRIPDAGQVGLAHIDHYEIENLLKFGTLQDFDGFFERVIQPVGEVALQSVLVKQYLFVDLILTVNQFIKRFVEDREEFSINLTNIENILDEINSLDEIRMQMKQIIGNAIDIRNMQVNHDRMHLLQKVSTYLEKRFKEPDLKMSEVAGKFNLTPNYFSTLFRQEMGETFRDFLAKRRINLAKELLRTTNLKIADIAYRSGYKDAHYFSYAFKKHTGQTPTQFRQAPQVIAQEE